MGDGISMMDTRQIESWALEIVDRVTAGEPQEDSRVELKADWPSNAYRTARQLAGHANAARGEPILWLIGLHEERGLVGARKRELAAWMNQVKSKFDGASPDVTDVNMSVKGKALVALQFETSRSPFVVVSSHREQSHRGTARLEVPWRESTGTRSANRNDLIRLLVPRLASPDIEPVSGYLRLRRMDKVADWEYEIRVFVTPRSREPVVLPFHRMSGNCRISDYSRLLTFDKVALRAPVKPTGGGGVRSYMDISYVSDSFTIESSSYEAVVHGPGVALVKGRYRTGEIRKDFDGTTAHLEFKLSPARTRSAIDIKLSLDWSPQPEAHRPEQWSFGHA